MCSAYAVLSTDLNGNTNKFIIVKYYFNLFVTSYFDFNNVVD